MSRSCLLLGANGFIGSHLVGELVAAGYKVRAFDRFSQLPKFDESDSVEIYKGDFFDDIAISEALRGVDYVFHSFSATTPFTSDSDPYTDINQNLLRNVQLFERIVEAKVKKVAFISSGGAVYGHIAEEQAVSESDAPRPVSPYGISKLATECYLAYFERKYNLEYVVYRLTNPYGPGQITRHNQGVIPAFIEKIQKGEELVIYGDGSSSRDFIYIGDATKMMVESFSQQAQYSTYNIGSGKQTDLNMIVSSIEEITGDKAKVRYVEAPKTFLKKTMVNVERFSNEFGVKSETSLENGLRAILKQ